MRRSRRTRGDGVASRVGAVLLAVGLVGGGLVAVAGLRDTVGRQPAAAVLDPPVVAAPEAWRPAIGTRWDWQLAAVPRPPYRDVDVLDVDGFDATAEDVAAMHAAGLKVVCYLSGGSWEDWRPDAADFPPRLIGAPLDGWPGEWWLDVRDVQVPGSELAEILDARLRMCRDKGFDAVEWDNVDGYQNDPGFPLTADDQLVFNQHLFNRTHAHGMSVLLKNDPDQVRRLLPYADGALVEQCAEYDECERFAPFVEAGKPVLVAEYQPDTAFCDVTAPLRLDAVRFDVALDGSVWEPCE